jgi:hypothetical protein
MRFLIVVALTAALGGGLLLAQAQDGPPVVPPPAPKPGPEPKPRPEPRPEVDPPRVIDRVTDQPPVRPGTPRDPTLPSDRLRESLRPPIRGTPSAPAAEKVPVLVLRGRVLAKGKPPAALLEVDGKLHIVGKDSIIQAGGQMLKVKDITAESVQVEAAPLSLTFTLR